MVEASGVATVMPGPPSGLRARAYPDDVMLDRQSVRREARVTPEYRWSVEVCIPSMGDCFTVRTKWSDKRTIIDKGRFVPLARMSLLKFLKTGKGLTRDRDGGFTL